MIRTTPPSIHSSEVDTYIDAAKEYLAEFYKACPDEHFFFGLSFTEAMIERAREISTQEGLEGWDQQNAVIISTFRFAGITDVFGENTLRLKLFRDFANQVNYPESEVNVIAGAIESHLGFQEPNTRMEQVAWDAMNSTLSMDDLIVHLSFIKEETNRLTGKTYNESEVLNYFKRKFIRWNFYTHFSKQQYGEKKEKNLAKLVKRLERVEKDDKSNMQNSLTRSLNLSSKETDDLFKIAFRNYSHLVSVADSKAGLLIHVNSIIISIVFTFLLGKGTSYHSLMMPSVILLTISFMTICLGILASRPQSNRTAREKNSRAYQTFFFGSFDLIGHNFLKVDWETYASELMAFLKGSKENVTEHMFRETFHVRRVLSKKFTYLSIAYWVFLVGLLLSILTFLVRTYFAND